MVDHGLKRIFFLPLYAFFDAFNRNHFIKELISQVSLEFLRIPFGYESDLRKGSSEILCKHSFFDLLRLCFVRQVD